MKFKLLILTLSLLSVHAFCQSKKNSLSFAFSNAGNSVASAGIGAAGYKGERALLYDLNYNRAITNHFSVETGVEYSINNVLLDYVDAYYPGFVPKKATIKLMSIPVYANVSFARYFFVNGGFVASFETSHESDAVIKDKSGLGFGLGIGAKYNFNNVSLFVNPFTRYGNYLITQGVKIGAGYRF